VDVSDLSSIYVKPIVRFQQLGERAFKPIEAVGTGLLFGDHKFLTCWHCVSAKLAADEVYGIPYKQVESVDAVHSEMATIVDIERDLNGTDLALASIPLRADPPIPLSRVALDWGDWAMSCGYPLPVSTKQEHSDDSLVMTHLRVFRGYVTSIYVDDLILGTPSMVYELDMPSPGGVSGSPLLSSDAMELVGIVIGERARSIPGTDEFLVLSLAYHLEVLKAARFPSLAGRELGEFF